MHNSSTYIIYRSDVEESIHHACMRKLKADDTCGCLFAAIAWKYRMRSGNHQFVILHRVTGMFNHVNEAFGALLMVLQYSALIPSLIDSSRMIVAKFTIVVHFNLTVNELPTCQAAHGGHKSQRTAKALYQATLLMICEFPFPVTGVRDFGIEDE